MTRNRIGLIAAIVAITATMIACGGGGDAQDKAKRDCQTRGGIYQKTSDHSGRCLPPRGGWQ